eukprot:scaffold71152_cov73-Phaeocystis_antarctica.AAC.2
MTREVNDKGAAPHTRAVVSKDTKLVCRGLIGAVCRGGVAKIGTVVSYRVAQDGEVRAYLVRSPGDWLALDEARGAAEAEQREPRRRRLASLALIHQGALLRVAPRQRRVAPVGSA